MANARPAFLVTDPSVQNLPDEPTKAMGNHPDSLIVPQARNIPSVENLEETSFVFDRRVGGLIENTAHLTVAFRGPVSVTDSSALVVAGAGTDP